ncbi:hypothetical protein D3C71_1029830 [compost metagenome]
MVATGTRGSDHLLNGSAHGVELVITGNLLHQSTVIFEQHKVAQVVEQHLRRQCTAHQSFKFVELPQRIESLAVDGSPAHEALGIC